jgi:hypothetical protein
VLLALLACGATYILTHAPASALRLDITIADLPLDATHISITAFLRDRANGPPVVLTGGQQLTCNGVVIPSGVYKPVRTG